jgi:hypothetical protein
VIIFVVICDLFVIYLLHSNTRKHSVSRVTVKEKREYYQSVAIPLLFLVEEETNKKSWFPRPHHFTMKKKFCVTLASVLASYHDEHCERSIAQSQRSRGTPAIEVAALGMTTSLSSQKPAAE